VLLLLRLWLTAGLCMPWSRLDIRRRASVNELVDAPILSVDQPGDLRPQARPHHNRSHLVEDFLEMLFIASGLTP
jgi:hypothetical protein